MLRSSSVISERDSNSAIFFTKKPLEQGAAAFELFLRRYKVFALAIASILYFILTSLRARDKPFWYDEILTLLEATQSTLTACLKAAGNADWMPPLSRIPFYVTDKLLGHGLIVFRLSSMIGFWVFCLCLFWFVQRRTSIYYAFAAMFLPFATRFADYSFEARSYGIVLGFCGIALLSWQFAADGKRRKAALAILALAIAGAVLNHYWAVFLYLPLAGAEAYRDFRRRQIDWGIWGAMAAGSLPLLISLLVILRVVHSILHPWSSARPADYRRFYTRNFRVIVFAVPAALMLLVWLVIGGRREKPAGAYPSAVRDYEWVAAVLFLLAPVAAISLALLVPPHTYVDRYLALATAGFALVLTFAAAHLGRRRASIGALCAIAGFAPFAASFGLIRIQPRRNSFVRAQLLRQTLATRDGPVVVADHKSYLEIWYYAPAYLKPRILCLNDEQASVKYRNRDDSNGKSLHALGAPYEPYREFATSGKQFLIYVSGPNWIVQQILSDGGRLEKVASNRKSQILRAYIK